MKRARWGLGVLVAALALAAPASSEVPPGPRLFLAALDLDKFRSDLLSIDAAGTDVRRIAGGSLLGVVRPPIPLPTGAAWPADGSWMAFSGFDRRGQPRIYISPADGRNLRAVPKTRGAQRVAVSPDGRFLAFSRNRLGVPRIPSEGPRRTFSSTTVWVLDLSTSSLKRLTPWRNNKHTVPTSFSPDGSMLAASSQDGRGYRAIGIDLSTGGTRVLARNARDPVFSPDGSRLALISYRDGHVSTDEEGDPVLTGELYVKSLLDGGMTRLTHSEGQDESTPSWDPSGERLAYTQRVLEAGSLSVAMQINANGTCPQLVLGATRARPRTAYGAPTWQPGPGREAGRIEC